MILYFTGTGNSRYLAEGIAKITGDDEIVSINELMKVKDGDTFKSEKPFVLLLQFMLGKYLLLCLILLKIVNLLDLKKLTLL